jgi:predicted RND superfamily exporter protein
MVKFGRFIARHRILVLVLSVLLLIPALFGYISTRVNYDVLTYLPEDIDTMVGQNILMDEFGKGGFSLVVIEGMEGKDIAAMSEEFSQVEGVADVISYDSLAGTSLPQEMIPDSIRESFQQGEDSLMVIFFSEGTSSDETLSAITQIRQIAGKQVLVGGMSAIIADTRDLCEQEEPIYVVIAVALCCVVLALTMESFLLPVLFLVSIVFAILYNMGTNLFLGEISYITKALAAVLQLGVTMDYSIFLWHSYTENRAHYDDSTEAMAHAISATFNSVLGSSMTTVAGFIALCFMSFTLGLDMGIVMAKGVLLGVICCVTVLPSLILTFEKAIVKTTHKKIMPDVGRLSGRIMKHYKLFLVLFVVLILPAVYGYTHNQVYYKLDSSLPETLGSVQANQEISDTFDMGAVHMLLLDADTDSDDVRTMSREMEEVDGVTFVLGAENLTGSLVPDDFIPEQFTETLESGEHKLMLIGSEYATASDEVNQQVEQLSDIAKTYDEGAMLIGEAPCTKDLIRITDHDFQVVSAVSILLVFVIIALVLRSFLLPVLLVAVIEFAIFVNMAIPTYTGSVLPSSPPSSSAPFSWVPRWITPF